MSKNRGPKIERVSVTLHFIRGVDDEAIAFIEGWPRGDRSYNMKMILLGQLDALRNLPKPEEPKPDLQGIADGIAWLQDSVYRLPDMIQEMLSKVVVQGAAPVQSPVKKKSTSREERMRQNPYGDDD